MLIGVLLITTILRRGASPEAFPTPIPPRTEPVVVANQDIPVQSVLRPEDLRIIEVPLEAAPVSAVSSLDDAAGSITKIPLVSGETLMRHHLADPTNVQRDLAFTLGPDQVLMAFPATDLMSQINVLQPGDRVDILVSVEQEMLPGDAGAAALVSSEEAEEVEALFTFNALQQVEISAVIVEITPNRRSSSSTASSSRSVVSSEEATPQPTPTPDPSEIEARAVLIALDPQDALVLKHLKDAEGIVDIVLRSPGSPEFFDLRPVTSDYLIDRYELIISR